MKEDDFVVFMTPPTHMFCMSFNIKMTTYTQVVSLTKVVVVMGATGTGKSRLAIDLATIFHGEVINSDKIQVYKGLDVTINKVSKDERRGIPHHLLGIMDDPNEDFTAEDFVSHALLAADDIVKRSQLPIIAGGSNSFIQALIDDPKFRSKYECCFIWVDVSMPVLHSNVRKRVDRMVVGGLVEEARGFFGGDYSRGIRRAIGMAEMDKFFRVEGSVGAEDGAEVLKDAIEDIKENTCKLIHRQLEKIFTIGERLKWRLVYRLDATDVFLRGGGDAADDVWRWAVVEKSRRILNEFLGGGDEVMDSKSGLRILQPHFACSVTKPIENNLFCM